MDTGPHWQALHAFPSVRLGDRTQTTKAARAGRSSRCSWPGNVESTDNYWRIKHCPDKTDNGDDEMKTHYIIAWVIIVLYCLWVEVNYQSTYATVMTAVFVGGPALLMTSLCGFKKDEADQYDE